jgi:aliphatic nitrilase
VAFPEVFVAGYPYWSWIGNPVEGSPWFERLVRSAVEVPGPEVGKIAAAAARHKINVVIGINERNRQSIGTLYNTVLTISDEAASSGATASWCPPGEKPPAPGDGAALRGTRPPSARWVPWPAARTPTRWRASRCWPRARWCTWPATSRCRWRRPTTTWPRPSRCAPAAHSFEGKVFTVVSCSTVSEEIIQALESDFPKARELLSRKSSAFSGFLGPDGRVIGEPLIDQEGIVYAELDLSRCIQPRQMHDITGHYNRFDVFDLRVNRRPLQAARFDDRSFDAITPQPGTPPAQDPQHEHPAPTASARSFPPPTPRWRPRSRPSCARAKRTTPSASPSTPAACA